MNAPAYIPSVAFVTMGCAKNEVDSAHMANSLDHAGYRIVEDPECADVVIVNTCSFIQVATEESIDAILEVAGYPSIANGSSKLIVAGCMPSRYGSELEAELPEACRFVACDDEEGIAEIVQEVLGKPECTDTPIAEDCSARGHLVSSYVKISDGCDRFCSYCTIPFIRGRYHSYAEDSIIAEIEGHVSAGACEITLIAQDTGRWGDDFDEPSSLATLMDHLASRFPDTWLRVMYIQPEGITEELLDVVAAHDNICNYFDIPFQHVDPSILGAMNRTGSREEFSDLISSIRSRIPDATLRTTLIVGYPGETDEMFEELCDFVENADLDYVGIFPYSREDGTRADHQDGHLDEDVKLERFQILHDIADDVCTSRMQLKVGKRFDVLVCGVEEDGQLYGRAMFQAPDVDGVTFVPSGEIGTIVEVEAIDSFLYDLEGER